MLTIEGRSNLDNYFIYSVKLIIFVVVCIKFNGIHGQGQEGDLCYLPDGGQGRCQDQSLCPALLTGSDDEPVICSSRRNKRIICCEIYNFPPSRISEATSTTRRYEERPVWPNDNNQAQRPNARPNARPTVRPTSRPAQKPNPVVPFHFSDRMSKAEQMCTEYAKLVQKTVQVVALTPDPDPVTLMVEQCDFSSLPLIVGGTKSGMGEFPHMAAIGFRDSNTRKIIYDCGGSLISEFFVMTAAHCCTTRLPVEVRLGAMNITAVHEASQPVNYRVVDIIRHPEHKASARYNDIALLRLAEKVKFTKYIRPACIYTHDPVEENKAIAIGWGKIDFAEDKSDLLLKVHIDIIDSTTCNQLYNYDRKTGKLRDGIVPSMLCAGDLKGGKDTCQGDSGGPLQVASSKNQCLFSIIGVTSFGKFCAAENSPGVYTRVSHFAPWIESVVWP